MILRYVHDANEEMLAGSANPYVDYPDADPDAT